MLLILEVGLTIYGIVALCTGKFSFGKGIAIEGWQARLLGAICFCTLPFILMVGFAVGFFSALNGIDLSNNPAIVLIDLIGVGAVIGLCLILISVFQKQQAPKPSQPYNPFQQPPTSGPTDGNNPYSQR